MTLSPNIALLIAKRLAAPKEFCVVTTFECGKERRHETETKGQANNYADIERRKVGKRLIDRRTGEVVLIVSVTVEPI